MDIINKNQPEVKPDEPKTSWCLIPPEVWEDESLNLTEKCLLGRIIALQDAKGYCYAGNKYLARQLGKSAIRVSAVLSKLVNLGYLTREVRRDSNKQIVERKIYLPLKTMIPHIENNTTPPIENNKDRVDILDKNIEKRENSLNYLKAVPDNDRNYFSLNFRITPSQVQDKADTLLDYCEAKGRSYKNYKAFLRNAIRSEYGKRPTKVLQSWEKYVQLPNDVRVGNLDKMKKLKEGIGI